MSLPLQFTGERFLPGTGGEIAEEHWHRYLFARRFAKDRRVVDAACGEGYGSALLSEVAGDVVGIDIDAKTIAHAGVRKAWTAWQPDIVATGTFDHTSAPAIIPAGVLGPLPITIVEENSKYATFQLSQPLLTPQGLFGPGIANSATEAAERGADEAREQVLLNVARTYLVLQGIEGLLIAARDAEKVALRREQDARARIAAGKLVGSLVGSLSNPW